MADLASTRVFGNLTVSGQLNAGGGELVPSGVVVMWSGGSSNIPSGWALCDGANGTPDLRDRFVVGAGGAYADSATGGSKDAVVVSHSHSGSTSTDGDHTHQQQWASWSSGTAGSGYDVSRISVLDYTNPNVSNNGSHNHSLNINSNGESGTDKNLPPYYALAFIMKL